MQYRVHKYYIVREVVQVEAGSQEEACKVADKLPRDLAHAEDNDDPTEYFLVDELGDEEHDQTRWYRWNGRDEIVEFPIA